MIKGLETENNLPTLEVNMNLNHFSDRYQLCYFPNQLTLAYSLLHKLQDESILGENTYNQKLPSSKYNCSYNTV